MTQGGHAGRELVPAAGFGPGPMIAKVDMRNHGATLVVHPVLNRMSRFAVKQRKDLIWRCTHALRSGSPPRMVQKLILLVLTKAIHFALEWFTFGPFFSRFRPSL
jgi:hypothetical protein